MKTFLASVVVLALGACGHDFNPCPDQTPCPAPSASPCPVVTPCPDCPPLPPPCPVPPVPPELPDVQHVTSEFEITAVLAAPEVLGLYISDPNGAFSYGIFPMPELRQKLDYEQVLTITPDGETTYDVGTTEGKEDSFGLVVSALCEREFSTVCDATVTTNGNDFKNLQITMTSDPNIVFSWDAK